MPKVTKLPNEEEGLVSPVLEEFREKMRAAAEGEGPYCNECGSTMRCTFSDEHRGTVQSKREVREPGRFRDDLVYELRNEADELGVYLESQGADCRDAVDLMYVVADKLEELERNKQASGREYIDIDSLSSQVVRAYYGEHTPPMGAYDDMMKALKTVLWPKRETE